MGNLLQVLEVTGWFCHDLTQKVHAIVSQGVHAEAQMRHMLIASKCKSKKATASDIYIAFI